MNRKNNSIVIYEPEFGSIKIETRIENESIWLTQGQIALAFGVERPAITKHLNNIFNSGELKENAVSSKIELTATDNKKYLVKVYNLDAIICVGYRVNTKKATQFRIWAASVLKKHILDGYTINQNLLNESNEKIRNLQTTIDIIRQANDKLLKTNNLKNEFVSLATHQIRGPLGAIKGYISLILEGDYGKVPKEFNEPLDIIFKSINTLGKTVSDFLDISRIEQGAMKLFLKEFDLADLVVETVNEFKKTIESSNLDLKLDISGGPFIINSDKAKLKQVLVNLIDNSNKYTKTGYIQITLKKKIGHKVLFSIKDSGVGIKKEVMPLLFQKFSRCSDASKANILGTGLGLYVAKKMIESQNGRVWAESEGENKGAQFYVELDLIK